ncbi:MAG TPA: biotin/lipoyl-containing protein [Bacteroidota bacterium]|nr:biotin/lipoyl-containing protein [Bacteroidota bacterium]
MKKLLVTVAGKQYEVEVEILEDTDASYTTAYRAPVPRPSETFSPAAPAPRPKATPVPAASSSSKSLASPINGVVIEVPVTEGQSVSEGDTLFVLEAMKMKTNIAAPQNGKIKSVKAAAGDTVEAGQELVTFE